MRIEVDDETAIDMHNYQKNMLWTVIKSDHHAYDYKVNSAESYSIVEFHFTFQRNPVFYGTLLIFSISLITALMIFTFILPANSGERMGVALTLMLASMVFILLVAENIPLNLASGSVPLLAIFFIFCLVLMAIMIIALSCVSKFYHKDKEDGKMSEWTRRNVVGKLSYAVGARAREKTQIKDTVCFNEMRREDYVSSKPCDTKEDDWQMEWRILGKTVDRCLFVFFNIVFVIGVAVCFGIENQIREDNH